VKECLFMTPFIRQMACESTLDYSILTGCQGKGLRIRSAVRNRRWDQSIKGYEYARNILTFSSTAHIACFPPLQCGLLEDRAFTTAFGAMLATRTMRQTLAIVLTALAL
jgi:hypothetical protein